MTRVAMGGTFDAFHKGHRLLLDTAFRDGDEFVQIGVTSDDLAGGSRARRVRPFAARAGEVERYLAERGVASRGRVVAIDHPFGFALDPSWDTIVATRDTLPNADRINAARATRGLDPLRVRVAPLVLADDGLPVRATRIADGEVDSEGRLARAPLVAVGSENPVKVEAARRAFARLWPKVEARGVDVVSGVPEQPIGEDTWRGAQARARAALAAVAGASFGVGIEAGLVPRPTAGIHVDVPACCIVDAGGRATWGDGPAFAYPSNLVREMLEDGASVGAVMARVSGDPAIGRGAGAVGFLSRGAVDRAAITESAVAMALLPRMRPDLYALDREC